MPVQADSGAIGGNVSHEFHVLADSGEDAIAFSSSGEYAANIETRGGHRTCRRVTPHRPPRELRWRPPGNTVSRMSANTWRSRRISCVKTLLVQGTETDVVALVLRGDHELNTVKAEKLPAVASPLQFASDEQIRECRRLRRRLTGPVGPVDTGHRRSRSRTAESTLFAAPTKMANT